MIDRDAPSLPAVQSKGFKLHLSTRVPLAYRGEDDYIHIFKGRILPDDAPDLPESDVGRVEAWLMDVGRLQRLGMMQFGQLYEHSEAEAGQFMFTVDILNEAAAAPGGELLAELLLDNTHGRAILGIDNVELVADHRRRGLGLAAVLRLVDMFAPGCAAVILNIRPPEIDWEYATEAQAAWQRRVGHDQFACTAEESMDKLERYWRLLGFRRIGDLETMVLDPRAPRPSAEELLPHQ